MVSNTQKAKEGERIKNGIRIIFENSDKKKNKKNFLLPSEIFFPLSLWTPRHLTVISAEKAFCGRVSSWLLKKEINKNFFSFFCGLRISRAALFLLFVLFSGERMCVCVSVCLSFFFFDMRASIGVSESSKIKSNFS